MLGPRELLDYVAHRHPDERSVGTPGDGLEVHEQDAVACRAPRESGREPVSQGIAANVDCVNELE